MLAGSDVEMGNTRKMLAAVPDGHWAWKPHEKSMDLATLAGHIAGMASWGKGVLETDALALGSDDYQPCVPAFTTDFMATFDKDKSDFRELLAEASGEDMCKIWSMTWNGKKVIEMPRAAVLGGMVTSHMIYHRGQLSVYLRLLGASVSGPYGPTADEKQ